MIYRVCISANNVKTLFDFADPVNAINWMTSAFQHYSEESDDRAIITLTIVEK